jgi:hypothetical protein
MSCLWPPEIQIVDTPRGHRFVFPWRDTPAQLRRGIRSLAWAGALALLAGTVVLGYMLGGPPAQEPGPGFAASGVLLMLGAMLFGYGWCLSWTRSGAELTATELRLWEQRGALVTRRVRTLDRIDRLNTHFLKHLGEVNEPDTQGVIEIVGRGAQALWFAADYPRDWLLAVAEELARRCGVAHEVMPLDSPQFRIHPFLLSEAEDEDTFDHDQQPATSAATVAVDGDELHIVVPPGRTVRRVFVQNGALIFLFLLLWPAALCWDVLVDGAQVPADSLPFAAVMAAVGGVLFMLAVRQEQRTVVLVVQPHRLLFEKSPLLFWHTRREWRRSRILAIRTGDSSPRGEAGGALELQIHFADMRHDGILGGRDPAELRWLATVLRRALDVPATVTHFVENPTANSHR